jgi:hypothetical protein
MGLSQTPEDGFPSPRNACERVLYTDVARWGARWVIVEFAAFSAVFGAMAVLSARAGMQQSVGAFASILGCALFAGWTGNCLAVLGWVRLHRQRGESCAGGRDFLKFMTLTLVPTALLFALRQPIRHETAR